VPGLSLSYLGSNLKVGDALIGTADMNALYAANPLFGANNPGSPITLAFQQAKDSARALAEVGDRTPEEVAVSKEKEHELQQATEGIARCLDLWCAEPLGISGARHLLETGDIQKIITGDLNGGTARLVKAANEEAERRHFLHWPLAFPNVFMRDNPGFDVVIGNPPWNEVTVDELRYYALHDPGLWEPTEAGRQARIQQLDKTYPQIRVEFERLKQDLATERQFFGPAGGYILQGAGDPDLYKLFCERYGHLTRETGWLGVVLPRNAFLVEGARGFRRWLFKENTVSRLDFLLNNRSWAFPIHPQFTIALVSAQRLKVRGDAEMCQTGPSANLEEFLANSRNLGISVPLKIRAQWTPSLADDSSKEPSWEVPLLPTQAAVGVFTKLRKGLRFDYGYPKVWKAILAAELHETHDKKYFSHKDGLPVWKGRSFEQYDPHGEEPAGYAHSAELEKYLQNRRKSSRSQSSKNFSAKVIADARSLPFHHARVAFRHVSRATDSRTMRACLIPPETALTNSAPYLVFHIGAPLAEAFVLGVMNSLPFDWQARRFVEMNFNFFIQNMLCFPPVDNTPWERIGKLAARLSCVDERFIEFARAAGVEAGPLKEDRNSVRAEIDALIAHAYRLDEADLYTIFGDFTERAVPAAYRERVVAQFRKEAR